MNTLSAKEVIEIGNIIGVDWDSADVNQLAMGIEVEKEHDDGNWDTDVLPGTDNYLDYAKIALAHLKELPDYYTRLRKMEKNKFKSSNLMENLFSNINALKEEEASSDDHYLDEYLSKFILTIKFVGDFNKTEVLHQIRAIPNVTTVKEEHNIAHHNDGTRKVTTKGLYVVRFVLDTGEDPYRYVENELIPKMKRIEGLHVHKFKGIDKKYA